MGTLEGSADGGRPGGDAIGNELERLAATLSDVRAACYTRGQALDEIEARLASADMSASQATALREALKRAREVGERLLKSLDDDDVRLIGLRRLLAD